MLSTLPYLEIKPVESIFILNKKRLNEKIKIKINSMSYRYLILGFPSLIFSIHLIIQMILNLGIDEQSGFLLGKIKDCGKRICTSL